jgi:vacuolar-type H+-ATPase subunit E/Vma4
MNKDRRARIQKIIDQVEELWEWVDGIKSEEEEYFDNMPEGLQQGEKGSAAEAAIDTLDEALDNLSSACDYLRDVIGE